MQSLFPSQIPPETNRYLYAVFLFIYTDFKTILIPQTLIGILQASTGPLLTTETHPDIWAILRRTHMVLLWNGLNLLTFTITNQRLPQSIAEDSINKPWRPIASGLISPDEAQRLLLLLVPLTYAVSVAWTGAGPETLGLVALAWLYNDLEGGNESVILRHGLNGCGFALYTHASTMIAANEDNSLLRILRRGNAQEHVFMTPLALHWLGMQACIVATTIHAMDLPDMEGDSKRGRRTLPLVIGEGIARVWLACGCLIWSVFCLYYWDLFQKHVTICLLLLGWSIEIGRRALVLWDTKATQRTYQMWCVWLTTIYTLPWFAN